MAIEGSTLSLYRTGLMVASHVSRTSSPGTFGVTPSCTKVLWHQFSRQYTPGHRTVFSLKFTIGVFAGMCLGFFIGGSFLLHQSLSLVQMRVVYSDAAPMSTFSNEERSLLLQGREVRNISQADQPLVSDIKLPVKQDMDAPIHIYYLLHDFYQSHKRYVRSVSYAQMHGSDVSASALDACKPQRYLTNEPDEQYANQGLINPCGLAAWSLFNDTFTQFKVIRSETPGVEEEIVVDSSNLAWKSDRESYFGDTEPVNHNILPAQRGGRALEVSLNQDEVFMTWMRLSAHPNVRKFYGTINQDLKKGDELRFLVTHNFNTYDFEGKKELLVTTSGAFGNRNPTFGVAWISMGIIAFLVASTYTVLGWRQLWRADSRVDDLQHLWLRGTRHRLGSAVPIFKANVKGLHHA